MEKSNNFEILQQMKWSLGQCQFNFSVSKLPSAPIIWPLWTTTHETHEIRRTEEPRLKSLPVYKVHQIATLNFHHFGEKPILYNLMQ